MPPIDKDAKIQCPTPQHLQVELDALMAVLELREQEDTWEKMERGIIRFTGVTRGGGYKHLPLFIDGVGKMGVGLRLGQCMLSDRGRLSGVATELLQTLAPRLGAAFQPLVPVYLPPLIQLLGRPNKVFLKRAEKCLWTIISNCHLPTILFELRKGLSDEAATCRRGCAAGFERALIDWDRSQFGEKGVGCLEEALRKVGADKDVEVRGIGKRLWVQYSEIWPERVDEFSAPLTPTIRRYLGVSAAASAVAGPSKPKAPAQRQAPTRPPPSTLSASTSSVSVPTLPTLVAIPPPDKAVTPPLTEMPPPPAPLPSALSSRAVRPPLLSTQSEAIPLVPKRSPPRFAFPGGPAMPSQSSDIGESSRHRILSSRAPRYPPGVLGQHTRSVSHNILPQPEQPLPVPMIDIPIRPSFPTSFSTTSLPLPFDDITGSFAPTRRFPEGAKPIRIPSSTSISEDIEYFAAGPSRSNSNPITPHPLRGAFRPVQQPQQRRDLGQAQRRIVTAPTPSSSTSELDVLRTSTSVRDRISEMERKAVDVPLPISPVIERLSRGGTPVKVLVGREVVVDSPKMPMLARSLRGKEEDVKEIGDLLRDEEIPDEMGDMTLRSDPGKKVDIIASADLELVEEGNVEMGKTEEEYTSASLEKAMAESTPVNTLPTSLSPTPIPIPTSVSNATLATQTTTSITPSAPIPSKPLISAPTASIEPKTRKPPLPPIVPKPRLPPAITSERLPPVTTTRTTKPRIPAQEPRKPFRPTTKPLTATSTGTSSKEASVVIPKEQVVRVSKPPIPPRVVSSTSAKPTTKSSLPPPPPAAVPVRSRTVSSNLTKPTASSLHRAAPPPTTKVSRPPAVVNTSTTSLPPPIKKDKVKRKAAVPSFRPTRTAESIVGKGTVSLSASTSSVTSILSRSQIATRNGVVVGREGIVAKVRVKPEAIALPLSPDEKRAVEIPLPPSPAIGEFMGRVKVRSKPEEIKVVSPRNQAIDIPLPLSPVSPWTSTHVSSSPLPAISPSSPMRNQPIPVSESETLLSPNTLVTEKNGMGLPLPPIRDQTPISKSTVEPTSDWMGSDSGDDMDMDSEAGERVIFARTGRTEEDQEEPKMVNEEAVEAGVEERDLIQFSTSTRAIITPSPVLVLDTASQQHGSKMEEEEEEEKDLIEFSAPSRPLILNNDRSFGAENDLITLDVDLSASGKGMKNGGVEEEMKGSSPRIALGERDRNGFSARVEELLL